MERPVLSADRVAAPVKDQVASFHRATVDEVAAAVEKHPVVVVGMKQNPVVKRARRILAEEGIAYEYLEYGSYLSQWKRRLAIKLWAGFPTFPMVFIDGTLIGGASELEQMQRDGSLKRK
jgi:glutaredoxin-related protein